MTEQTLQSAMLDMLLTIDRICRKHAIPYQLAAGTLLGAVRDQNIIPWDNDADVCMLRSDYERFMAVAESELDERFFLQHYKSEPLMFSLVTKLRLNGTQRRKTGRQADNKLHQGIWVDVFAFDDVRPHTLAGNIHMALCAPIKYLLELRSVGDRQRIWRAHKPFWFKLTAWLVYQPLRLPSKARIMRWSYRMVTWYSFKPKQSQNGTESVFVTCLVSMPIWPKDRLPRIRKRSDFMQLTEAKLAGHSFPIPRNYDEVLTNLYGDYMTPLSADRRPEQLLVEFDQSTGITDKPAQSSGLIDSRR